MELLELYVSHKNVAIFYCAMRLHWQWRSESRMKDRDFECRDEAFPLMRVLLNTAQGLAS